MYRFPWRAIGTAPASRRSCRSWSSKQYILAALAGTLAVIAIVSVVSVLLCPAHIYFYLTDATYGRGRGKYAPHFSFTIVANNTSRLTQVQYREMKVEVWVTRTRWLPADVNTSAYPSWQQPRNTTNYGVFSNVTEYEKTDLPPPPQESQKKSDNGSGDNDEGRYPEVVIKAKVRFRYGHAGTRLYSIVVSCPSVNFTDEGHTHTRSGTNYLPVNCTA